MYNETTRMNGGCNAFEKANPTMIDGSYKSNNKNLNVQPTSTAFDPAAEGVGPWNKMKYKASEPRPFSKA